MSLWKNLYTFKLILSNSPRTRVMKNQNINQETSFCACRRASLTVEAAIVIPLLAGFLATILFLFRVVQVQVAMDEALMYAGRKVAVESSMSPSETTLLVSAEAFLLIALEETPVVESYVKNGYLGISLLGSTFSGKEINLKANYQMSLPVGFFGFDTIPLYSANSFQKWTGDSYISENTDEEWVYITPSGAVYHATNSCRVLDLSIQEGALSAMDDLRGRNGQRYYLCTRCGDDIIDGLVYYTDYGSLYHGSLLCSSLKRTISRVPLSEVGDRRGCSYCY